jgi:hypothetical protein
LIVGGFETTWIDAFGWPVKPILALLMAKSITSTALPATVGMYCVVGWLWEVLWVLRRWRNMVERVERAKMAVIGKVRADTLTSAVHNSSGIKL